MGSALVLWRLLILSRVQVPYYASKLKVYTLGVCVCAVHIIQSIRDLCSYVNVICAYY